MNRILLSSVACPVLFTLSHKRYDSRKNVIGYKMRVLVFSTNVSETFVIIIITGRDIIVNILLSSC